MSWASWLAGKGPAGWWRLGESTGATTAADASGNSRSATYKAGAITFGVTGAVVGDTDTAVTVGALSAGTTAYGAIVTDASWMNATSAVTFVCSVETTQTAVFVFTRWDASTQANCFAALDLSGSKARFYGNVAGTTVIATGATTVNNGSFHRLVGVFDGATLKVYVDGALDATATPTGSGPFVLNTPSTGRGLMIGGRYATSGNSQSAKTLDEPAFFASAWSAADVLSDWQQINGAVLIGRATETDTARAVGTPSPQLGRGTETDTARALTPTRAVTVGRGTETDTARALTAGTGGGAVSIGRATETDVALSLGRLPATRLAWDGGLGIAFSSNGGEFDPAYVAPPLPLATRVILAQAIDSVTNDGPRFTPSVRTEEDDYLAHRIVVGGVDVTYFRGIQTPLPTYGLVSPLLYGSGAITFPQVHAAYDRPGHGELSWLTKFAHVKVQRIQADGTVVATDFRGFISDFQHEGRSLTCTLGGEATGLAALQDRPEPIFPRTADIGSLVMPTIRRHLRLPTVNQPTTGIRLADTGGGSQLDFLTEVLAKSSTKDGRQWTVMPNASGAYKMDQKDSTTIDATLYIDGFRVVPSLRRDPAEEPNRVWGQGVGPDGLRIRPSIFPGLQDADIPFTGTVSPGDTGDAVIQLIERLFHIGAIDDRTLAWTTDSDDPITKAVKSIQDDAELTVTGVVNSATWAVIFRGDNFSLRSAQQVPAAQKHYTRPNLRDATGNILRRNPNYKPSIPFVDANVSDMGHVQNRRHLGDLAEQLLVDDSASNWVGTITVYTGAVIDGEHNPGDPLTTDLVRDVRSIKPGMNLWLPNWDGGTLIHVSGVSISPGQGAVVAEFAVDTRARDTMPVWQVNARNRESRQRYDRQWIAQNRRSGIRDNTGAFYDGSVFGKIPRTFLAANTWTVIPTPAGRSGVLQKIDLHVENDLAKYGVSAWGKEVQTGWLDRTVGDPFDIDGVTFGVPYSDHVERKQDVWQNARGLIDIWGDEHQPCGYWPRRHTTESGVVTDAPITGDFKFTAGAPYLCQYTPVIWLAIRPDRDCYVQGGRVLELLLDDGGA